MWKNIVQPDRPQMTIGRMCIACWITKATEAYSEYVTCMLVHHYIACTNMPKCSIISTLRCIIPTSLVLCTSIQLQTTTLVISKCYLKIPPVADPTGVLRTACYSHLLQPLVFAAQHRISEGYVMPVTEHTHVIRTR